MYQVNKNIHATIIRIFLPSSSRQSSIPGDTEQAVFRLKSGWWTVSCPQVKILWTLLKVKKEKTVHGRHEFMGTVAIQRQRKAVRTNIWKMVCKNMSRSFYLPRWSSFFGILLTKYFDPTLPNLVHCNFTQDDPTLNYGIFS